MRNYNTSLLLVIILLSLGNLIAQDGSWQFLPLLQTPVAAVETTEHIWIGYTQQIVQLDKQTAATVKTYEFLEKGKLLDLAVSVDGDVYFLNDDDEVGFLNEDGQWDIRQIPSSGGILNARSILAIKPDGTIYFRGLSIPAFYWHPSLEEVEVAVELINAVPENPVDYSYDPADQFWLVSDGLHLSGIQEGNTIVYTLPPQIGVIRAVRGNQNNGIWIKTVTHVFYYQNEEWFEYELEEEEAYPQLLLSEGALGKAALVTKDRVKWLCPGTDAQLEQLAFLSFPSSLEPAIKLLTNDVELWFSADYDSRFFKVDENANFTYGNYAPFLPVSESIDNLTTDRDGRIWMCANRSTYFFGSNRWRLGEEVYPGLPLDAIKIVFTVDNLPILITDDFGRFRVYMYYQDTWQLLEVDEDTWLGNEIAISPNGYLWNFSTFFGFQINMWYRGSWDEYQVIDFLPLSGNFSDMSFGTDDLVYVAANNGFFKMNHRYDYEFLSFEDLNIEATNSFTAPRIKVSPQGTVWFLADGQLVRIEGDNAVHVSIGNTDQATWDLWAGQNIMQAFADDNLWLTNRFSTLMHYDGHNWYDHSTVQSKLQQIRTIAQDAQGKTWVGGDNGIAIFTPHKSSSPAIHTQSRSTSVRVSPNPGQHLFHVEWEQPNTEEVKLELYNSQGQLVRTILRESRPAGLYHHTFLRPSVASGVYFLRLSYNNHQEVTKVILK